MGNPGSARAFDPMKFCVIRATHLTERLESSQQFASQVNRTRAFDASANQNRRQFSVAQRICAVFVSEVTELQPTVRLMIRVIASSLYTDCLWFIIYPQTRKRIGSTTCGSWVFHPQFRFISRRLQLRYHQDSGGCGLAANTYRLTA